MSAFSRALSSSPLSFGVCRFLRLLGGLRSLNQSLKAWWACSAAAAPAAAAAADAADAAAALAANAAAAAAAAWSPATWATWAPRAPYRRARVWAARACPFRSDP